MTLPQVRDGLETLGEVWDEAGNPLGGLGRIGGLS